ncbi:hypothetical protein [Nitrospira sp. KM1]|uniref:hypothetical protein n=1 Tax=Nitrospira sp. KM1 TaxID=1936990 RepID=UPI0015634AD7|nr:hypothetical protein [Nitrospira sp. KM1]
MNRPKSLCRNSVVQCERTGCGIASVAAVAGVSYAAAKTAADELGISAADARLWSDTQPVRRLLTRFGYRSAMPRPFRSWQRLPPMALLAIKWHVKDGRPYWHWVVFVRTSDCTCVLDSKKSLKVHVRTDFGRMKPKWYLAVSAKR